jgi:hypothetical protein
MKESFRLMYHFICWSQKGNLMQSYEDTWGLYHFFYPDTPEKVIHPDDLHAVLNMVEGWNGYISFYYLFHCIGIEEEFVRLRSETIDFRAKADNYKPVSTPKLTFGQRVRLKKKPEQIRRVVRLHYHYQNKVVVYHVESSDEVGRTYWFEEQLEPVDASDRGLDP